MNNIDSGLFFNSFSQSSDNRIKNLAEQIKFFIEKNNTQVYLLDKILGVKNKLNYDVQNAVSYTHLTLPTTARRCRSRWSPYH